MDAIAHIKKLSQNRTKRSDTLIVSNICGAKRLLGTQNWAHPICYAFRDALDIKPTPRIKIKKDPHNNTVYGSDGKPQKVRTTVWTQGHILSFKEGDNIQGLDVVIDAMPMGWDAPKNEMYLGHVTLGKISQLGKGASIIKNPTWSGTQIDFLELLITGNVKDEHRI